MDKTKLTRVFTDKEEKSVFFEKVNETIEKIKNTNSENQLKVHLNKLSKLFSSEEIQKREEVQKEINKKEEYNIKDNQKLYAIAKLPNFEVKKAQAFYTGSDIPLPESLLNLILKWIKEGKDITSLVNFWGWCCLNPNPRSRDSYFDHIKASKNFIITRNGLVVMYRRVKIKKHGSTTAISNHVSEIYFKLLSENNDPNEFIMVHKGDKYEAVKKGNNKVGYKRAYNGKSVNNLYGDYLNDPGKTIYTCARTGDATHGTHIEIGKPVTMPRNLCDDNPDASCSRGLHVGDIHFVGTGYHGSENPHNAGFGDVLLACLINPMNVVSVPRYDNRKIRVCEYFPFAVVTNKGLASITDGKSIENYDLAVAHRQLEEINKTIKKSKDKKDLKLLNNIVKNRVVKLK